MDRTATGTAPPNPALIFDTLNGYQRSAALKGAIDLDLFTRLGEGASTAELLAERCSAPIRGMRILCDYLVVMGLLGKSGNVYSLSQDSAVFLDRRSPACIGEAAGFLLHPVMTAAWSDIASVVRNDGTLHGEGTVSPDNPIWVDFARSMGAMARPGAQEIAREIIPRTGTPPRRVLDLAAGHGQFGIAVASTWPEAEIVACDWAGVLSVAEENAVLAGVADRVTELAGDAMSVDFGTGYDLVLVTNFFHHFNPATNEELLRKIRSSLTEGGRVITLEFIPDENRITPPISAAFSLVMLATTKAGDAYTFTEFEQMFSNAGFSRSELIQLKSSPQQVMVSY